MSTPSTSVPETPTPFQQYPPSVEELYQFMIELCDSIVTVYGAFYETTHGLPDGELKTDAIACINADIAEFIDKKNKRRDKSLFLLEAKLEQSWSVNDER